MELTNKPKGVNVSESVDKDTTSKTTVRRVRGYTLRSSSNTDYRKVFTLCGVVKKIAKSGEAVLVSSGDTATSYWLDIEKDKVTFKEGDPCRFSIAIFTFVGKDTVIKTKLKVREVVILPSDAKEELENGFNEGYGIINVELCGSQRTETPGLFLLSMQRFSDEGEPREFYYMRYFSNDRMQPNLGRFKVSFRLGKTKDLITDRGEIFTDVETRTYVDENGETVTKENYVYVTALAVKDIFI